MNNTRWMELMTGNEDGTELFKALLDDAESYILAETNRTKIIPQLQKPVRDMALIAYNRLGTEGEIKRTEAGESYEFVDIPVSVRSVINRYRLVRIGGHVHERVGKNEDAKN